MEILVEFLLSFMRLNLKGNNWQVTFCCSVLIMYNIKCNDFVTVLNTSRRQRLIVVVFFPVTEAMTLRFSLDDLQNAAFGIEGQGI